MEMCEGTVSGDRNAINGHSQPLATCSERRVPKLKANAVPSKFEKVLPSLSMDHSYEKSNKKTNDMDSSIKQSQNPCNDKHQMNNGPVLSVRCLHEDDHNDEVENIEIDKSGVVDITDIPELLIENSENLENHNEKEVSEEISEEENEVYEMEEHPTLMIGKIENVFSDVSHPSVSPPARISFEGRHKFRISVVSKSSAATRKTESTVYCEAKNKLYVCKDHPFNVIVSAVDVPAGSEIKVTAVYCGPEFSNEIVQRCATHAQQDYVKGHSYYLHLVQSFANGAVYKKEKNGQLSVSVPYEEPQIGETHTSYLFKVTCFSSCAGSINRRAFMLVFTLVDKKDVLLGKQVLHTKVCACPTRDYRLDLKRGASQDLSISTRSNHPEKPILSEQTSSKFSITVADPELYQFLEKMQDFYKTSTEAKYLTNMSQLS